MDLVNPSIHQGGLIDVKWQRTVSTVFEKGLSIVCTLLLALLATSISMQDEHHPRKSFLEEYESLVNRDGLQRVEEETVKTVSDTLSSLKPLDASRG